MREKASQIVTVVLVICAMAVAAAVVNREFLSDTRLDEGISTESRPVPGWEALLSSGLWIGPPDATAVIIEFGDFQCPFCASLSKHLGALRTRYGDSLAILYRHFPLSAIHPHSFEAAVAAECAAEQNSFAGFHDFVFSAQEAIGNVGWDVLAEAAGVPSVADFVACQTQEWATKRVLEDVYAADQLELTGTPSVIVNGTLLPGTPSLDTLDAYVRAALDAAKGSVDVSHDEVIGDSVSRPWATGPWLSVGEFPAVASRDLVPWARTVNVASSGRVLVPVGGDVVMLDEQLAFSGRLETGWSTDMISVSVSRSGAVSVLNSRRRVVSVFRENETISSQTIYLPSFSREFPYAAWLLDFAGMELLVAYERMFTRGDGTNADKRLDVLRRVSVDGELVHDSLVMVPSVNRFVVQSVDGVSVGPNPFGGGRYLDLIGNQRIVYATAREFDVAIETLAGGEVSRISHEVHPIAVTDQELEVAMNELPPRLAGALGQRSPHTWSPLVGVVVQRDVRRVWVGIRGSDRAVWEWAAFSEHGAHWGSVALPGGFELKAVHGRHLVGIRRGGVDGVPELVSYKLAP